MADTKVTLIFAVVDGNYYPQEVDSLWWQEEEAKKRANFLSGSWTVKVMGVQGVKGESHE